MTTLNTGPKPKIVVIGSSNTDMIVTCNRLPVPGETVLGGNFLMNPGGKGANQAIAAARLGAEVAFVAKAGNDLFGMQAAEIYRSEGVNIDHLSTDPHHPSGVALISVDSSGENCIIVASGSNQSLSPADIDAAEEQIRTADIVLMQLEIPMPTVEYAASMARRHGKRVILNPAPAYTLTDSLLGNLYAVLPNRIEAEMLSGIRVTDERSARKAALAIARKGIANVVVTLGRHGAFVLEGERGELIPAQEVNTVDTTGAGDVFCGAVSVYLSEGHTLTEAVVFANHAAALAVTRVGAQSAIPTRAEVCL